MTPETALAQLRAAGDPVRAGGAASVQTVAFPLISAGIYGWPLHDAIAIAAETISSASAEVDDVSWWRSTRKHPARSSGS